LAQHVLDAEEVIVPDHFHLEAAAALRRMELRSDLSREQAQEAFEQVLGLKVRRVDAKPLLPEVLGNASQRDRRRRSVRRAR